MDYEIHNLRPSPAPQQCLVGVQHVCEPTGAQEKPIAEAAMLPHQKSPGVSPHPHETLWTEVWDWQSYL